MHLLYSGGVRKIRSNETEIGNLSKALDLCRCIRDVSEDTETKEKIQPAIDGLAFAIGVLREHLPKKP